MASFKYLIFISLAVLSVYSVGAEQENKPAQVQADGENVRAKKHAYVAAPVLAYSAAAAYPYSAYPAAYPYAAYPAAYPSAYSTYSAYPSYSYAYDDGKYWPGKYEKSYYPAYKTAYPYHAYHY
ncbi:uncharacterized protein LOC126894854 [Daktulosphaira vitifoliae]|uniref:uncharacterized protein LOC126894854 n=1 Tax=Daktulosphaira vitifoliae TaxID=58002 RepID=UPI0021A9CC41|nr:uncharacterized protein LOC126894854 [Daktulosphaira vitifoliae]